MNGQVLDFTLETNAGVISGGDGQRYTFAGSEWTGEGIPTVGMRVDFQANDDVATAISHIGAAAGGAQKSKVVAGVLAILLGGIGVHKFYLGYGGAGALMLAGWVVGVITTMLLVGFFLLAALAIIALIEGIIYLTKSDEDFEETYVLNRKPWF